MRSILFTLMWFACAAAVAGDNSKSSVYKWVDESGVIHYSDQPHENATKVQIAAPQTYGGGGKAAKRSGGHSTSSSAPASDSQGYQRCTVTQPANDQAFSNTDSVSASVALEPGQRAGDQIYLMLDGQRVPGLPTASSQFTVPVERGTHTLQAVVQDSSGQVVCRSAGVTFHVHQPSVLNPANPVRAH
jgi:hypothetical protein